MTAKKFNVRELADRVRNMLVANPEIREITAYDLAHVYSVKGHFVEQAFHLLNLEGVLGQGRRSMSGCRCGYHRAKRYPVRLPKR